MCQTIPPALRGCCNFALLLLSRGWTSLFSFSRALIRNVMWSMTVTSKEEIGEFMRSYLLYLDNAEKHLNILAYCLTHFHPFGPSAGTDAHVAFGDDEISSGHPELLFKLLALLPKVQLTIVSCVPSRSCSSSSSC